MALLDEEALAPPCRNKADLLSEDQPVLGGAEGTCVLALFRSGAHRPSRDTIPVIGEMLRCSGSDPSITR